MALKTNQMQTDLKKYREEYDRIFDKKEKTDLNIAVDKLEKELNNGNKSK